MNKNISIYVILFSTQYCWGFKVANKATLYGQINSQKWLLIICAEYKHEIKFQNQNTSSLKILEFDKLGRARSELLLINKIILMILTNGFFFLGLILILEMFFTLVLRFGTKAVRYRPRKGTVYLRVFTDKNKINLTLHLRENNTG